MNGNLPIWLDDQIQGLNGRRILWMICLCYRSRFRYRAGWLHTFLSFLSDTSKLQSVVYSALLLNTLRNKKNGSHGVTLDRYLGTSKITWKDLALIANRQNCSHNRAAKHIKISCLPRESSQNQPWSWWILPQVIRDIHISPRPF